MQSDCNKITLKKSKLIEDLAASNRKVEELEKKLDATEKRMEILKKKCKSVADAYDLLVQSQQ